MDDELRIQEEVKALYPNSSRWAQRVERMSPAQRFAIYKKNLNKEQKCESSQKQLADEHPEMPF